MWTNTTESSSFISSTSGTYIHFSGDMQAQTTNGSGIEMKKPKSKGMPPEIFFKLMKKKMGVLKDRSYKKRIQAIELEVEKLSKLGQIAMSEQLMRKLFVLVREAVLYAVKKRIYLTREIYDRYKYKTSKPVKLTPLKNYARPIPDEVLAEKEKYKDYYDEYYVMHFDDAGTVAETESERVEREKDPILFGTIEYSDRLYFIDDWVDEYCDLTLDDIIDTLELEDEDVVLEKKVTLY